MTYIPRPLPGETAEDYYWRLFHLQSKDAESRFRAACEQHDRNMKVTMASIDDGFRRAKAELAAFLAKKR